MSYTRVIPRDLFNEANLLKCAGQLYLMLENRGLEHLLEHDGAAFRVEQSEDDGSITILNVTMSIAGNRFHLMRPLNARDPYPVYLTSEDPNTDDIQVFEDDGTFTDEMRTFLGVHDAV